ncbi:MAG TPA: hypothetical protein DEB40_03030 [Elusimicrobia bacterium]|nr:hypothetical protein [Elusimicrobiota bacterium]HBT60704.1 hypothetical protein [Elusimicrobiota bacterium]
MASHPLLLRPGPAARPLIRLSSDFLRAQEYFEAIISSTTDAIIATDRSGRIVYFSPGAEAMLGLDGTLAVSQPVSTFYLHGKEDARRVMSILRREGRVQDHEMVFRSRNGRAIHISMSASLLHDRAGRLIGTLGISKDITRRVELENRLRDLAITDDLTGLFNKRCFHERLFQEASRARRLRQELSLILFDLDGFKGVNDSLGHAAGDRILEDFAAAVEHSIRKQVDSAYRYGGDEFVVILPGLSTRRAQEVARRISQASRERAAYGGTGCSWGAATLSAARTVGQLLRLADRRMYRMKLRQKDAGRRPKI